MQIVNDIDQRETHIFLDSNEDERQVLRAIIKASFELAGPAGLTGIDYKPNYELSDAEADAWIHSTPRSYDCRIVDMNFVQGRQCRTVLFKEAAHHFALDARYFGRFRHDLVGMLNRAKHLLSNNSQAMSCGLD